MTDPAELEQVIEWATLELSAFAVFPYDTERSRKAKLLIDAARAHLATLPRTKLVWLVSENTTPASWRHFEDLDEALELAGKWVSQSVGTVTLSRVEVEA